VAVSEFTWSDTRVLDSKLRVPRMLGATVERTRLLDLIESHVAAGRSAFLVSAPAGAGKTMLLAQWYRRMRATDVPAAWVSLDGGDDDSHSFWSSVLAGCVHAFHEVPTPAQASMTSLRPPSATDDGGFLTSFLRTIEAANGPMWLILDDVHELASREVLAGLSRLLRNAPPQLHVVLSSRYDPPLPIPRMIVEGTAAEVRANDLALDADETRALLEGHGLDLVPDDFDRLLTLTDGWAVGVKLAALSLTQQKDISSYLMTFAGHDQPVADYLVSEVLSQQPAEIRAFLLSTAVPEYLTAELARELSGRVDAGALIDQLAHANILVQHDGRPPGVYQYQALLRTYLLAELDRRDATAARRLHGRVAEWFASRDAPALALGHAVSSHDSSRVAALIERLGPTLVVTGRHAVIASTVDAISDGAPDAPAVALVSALSALLDGKLADAQAGLDRLGRDPSRHDDSRLRLLHVTALLHEARLRGEKSPRVRRLIEESHAEIVDDPDVELLARAGRGMAQVALGDYVTAESELTEALQLARDREGDLIALECLSSLAFGAAALGDADGMTTRARQAIEFAAERGWSSASPMVRAHLIAGWGAWRLMDVDGAASHASHAAAIGTDVEPSISLSLRTLSAHTEFARTGDARRLVDHLRKAWANTVEDMLSPIAVSHYCVTELRVALATHQDSWADETLQRAERLLPADSGDLAVMAAMRDAHRGRNVNARAQLAVALSDESTFHVTTTEIAGWLLEAQLADANGEPTNAHDALVRAVELAAPLTEIRSLAVAPEEVRRLLIHGRGRFSPHDDFVDAVLTAANHAAGGLGRIQAAESLTPRELDLLHDLPSMLSIDEIATAHVVSVNTVKTHLKALYRKLEVTSRRSAVERARELGLI
jgi:LuxR family transcriptional regulator, maltose regulon positive regulatory protein